MKIKWVNRFSLEEGYVREILSDHFENTYDLKEGKKFRTRREAEKVISLLYDIGEGLNNAFEVVKN